METLAGLSEALHQEESWNPRLSSALTRAGIRDPEKVWAQLLQLRRQTQFPERYSGFFPQFLDCLAQSYDPDLAANNFLRLADIMQDKEHLFSQLSVAPSLLKALIILFSGSQVLSSTLLACPSHIDWLSQPETLEKTKTRDVLYREFYTLGGTNHLPENTPDLLRRFKRREYIRIGLRDLLGLVTLEENVEALSDLADVCLQVAYEFCLETLKTKHGVPMFTSGDGEKQESEFAILSMGKLGGRELNYSSDIDLIYIYTSSRGATEPTGPSPPTGRSISNHEFHTKLAQMITKTLHDITAEGNVFRVDLDLRPEGRGGEIANSLTRCETYYQSWGRTWERQAMIKARVSAGSQVLGQRFFDMITPFIYRRSFDFSAIEEVRALKGKIDLDLIRKKKEKGHIKLGVGGIREIEFFVQSYQLLFGGREKSLRETNTLKALAKLHALGLVADDEYRKLRAAYIFLRELENRVQISFGLQTHHLPEDEKSLDVLAKKMRMAGDAPPARVANLLDAFKRRTHDVHELFSNLFVDVADQESARRTLREGMARRVLETRFSPALMKEFRFHDPDRAHRFLKTLRDGPPTVPASEKSIALFFEVLPSILELCAQAPDPNGAVENLVRFIEASQAREMFLRLFSENGKVLELLLNLFGSGEVLPSILIKQPNLMDVLMNAESLYRFKTSMQMEQEAETLLADCAGKEGHAVPLRRFKQAEELRIGVRYLIRETGLVETMADLSALAELYLKLALRFATEDVLREKAFACGLDRFAIIAMGKLGGKELNFGSDLDLIFVYEEEEGHGDLVSGYSAISRKVVQYCSVMTPAGYAYKVDTDLRPEGSRGMLVLSLQGFTDYFKTRGRIWEQQAMTRARWVAGNQDLGERFLQVAHAFAYRPKLDYGSLIEIARLRERMEKELAQEAQKGKNVKLGAGGIADIEFTVQILQLMQGKRYPQLRQTNTLEVLSRAAQLSLMDGSEARQLSESYLFLRNLECALRLRSERMGNHLPVDGEMLAALARMVGYREDGAKALGDALMRDYERVTVLVRALFRKTVDVHLRMAQ